MGEGGRSSTQTKGRLKTKVICKTSTLECGDIFRRSGKICIVPSPLGYHRYMIKIRTTLSHTQAKNKGEQRKSGQITIRIAFEDVTFRFSPNDFRALLKSANLSTQKGTWFDVSPDQLKLFHFLTCPNYRIKKTARTEVSNFLYVLTRQPPKTVWKNVSNFITWLVSLQHKN